MPQTKQVEVQADGFKITGYMMGDAIRGDSTQNYNCYEIEGGGWYGFGGYPHKKNRFHLSSPQIIFKGKATVELTSDSDSNALNGWEIGFLQNLYRCERSAAYLERNVNHINRAYWRMRQNPTNLPIRDGYQNMPIWYGDSLREKKALLPNTPLKVIIDDAPNYDVPIKYTGEAGKEIGDYHKDENSKYILESTSGIDIFRTFFVAANVREKSLIILGDISWTIDWSGIYRHESLTWHPISRRMLKFEINSLDVKRYLPNLDRNSVNLPFNPHYGNGEENFQIKIGNSWTNSGGSGSMKNKSLNTQKWFT